MHWLTKKNEGEKEVKKNERKKERGKKTRKKEEQKNHLELRGIDPRTSHMLSARSTIWATAPANYHHSQHLILRVAFKSKRKEKDKGSWRDRTTDPWFTRPVL